MISEFFHISPTKHEEWFSFNLLNCRCYPQNKEKQNPCTYLSETDGLHSFIRGSFALWRELCQQILSYTYLSVESKTTLIPLPWRNTPICKTVYQFLWYLADFIDPEGQVFLEVKPIVSKSFRIKKKFYLLFCFFSVLISGRCITLRLSETRLCFTSEMTWIVPETAQVTLTHFLMCQSEVWTEASLWSMPCFMHLVTFFKKGN